MQIDCIVHNVTIVFIFHEPYCGRTAICAFTQCKSNDMKIVLVLYIIWYREIKVEFLRSVRLCREGLAVQEIVGDGSAQYIIVDIVLAFIRAALVCLIMNDAVLKQIYAKCVLTGIFRCDINIRAYGVVVLEGRLPVASLAKFSKYSAAKAVDEILGKYA